MADNRRIMYVCTRCADEAPEGCGHFDPNDLVVMPDGEWLCDNCWDDLPPTSKAVDASEERIPFAELPHPPVYVPLPTHPQQGER